MSSHSVIQEWNEAFQKAADEKDIPQMRVCFNHVIKMWERAAASEEDTLEAATTLLGMPYRGRLKDSMEQQYMVLDWKVNQGRKP